MTFSKRMGIVPEKKPLQLNDMDIELRIELHNDIRFFENSNGGHTWAAKVYRKIWSYFFSMNDDEYNDNLYWERCLRELYESYMEMQWNRVYDYIEHYFDYLGEYQPGAVNELTQMLAITLEKHNSGYRIVQSKFVPITNRVELEELSQAATTGLRTVESHMKQAIIIFSNRDNKDYRNVIKEAISAVEAAANFVCGTDGKVLDFALNHMDKKKHIHPTLKNAFNKLYYYSSDKDTGIRHALIEDANSLPSFADAKFMIVACSAFINWLLSREAE